MERQSRQITRSNTENEKIGDITDKINQRTDPSNGENYFLYSFSAYDNNEKIPVIESGENIKSAKYEVPDNSVLISKLNPRINRVWRVKKSSDNAICSTEFIVLKPKGGVPLDYVYAVLNEPNFRNYLVNFTTGTSGSHQRVRQGDILEYEMRKSTSYEKKIIGQIYGLFDDKIEINNQINDILSRVAQEIFKSWFVDYEPYEKFKKSDLGKIPNEFKITQIGELAWTGRGYSYSSEFLDKENEIVESYPMINLNNVSEGGGFDANGYKHYTENSMKDRYKIESGELILAITDLTQEGRVIGSPALIPNLNADMNIISQDLAKVKSNEISEIFLFHLFSTKRFRDYSKSLATGTTVLHLSLKSIKEFKFPVPPKSKVDDFTRQIKPIHQKKSDIIEENNNLRKLRDTLLPKMMSGEIRVDEIKLDELEVDSEV
jgi:type I restriction enzyme S subunit